MATKDQIEQIIQKRHERAAKLEKNKIDLKELLSALKEIRKLDEGRFKIKDDNLRVEFHNKIIGLGLPEAIRQTDSLIQGLDEVINRFSREYISIATIGKERQGKSRFLQAVSGLDNKVIPAYEGTSCTGATSVIKNDPSFSPGTLRAVITYRKREDIVSLVRGYVSVIVPDYTQEITFDNIGSLPLEDFLEAANEDTPDRADKQTAYGHLENIVFHFDEFRDLFDMPPGTYTDPDEIKYIVAQNNGKDKADPDFEQYYKYLAVARADILCQFFFDAGKIRLIDTVGIKSTQIGVIQAMLDTVKNESDAAIVVTKPDADPQTDDVKLNTDITTQFKDKLPKKWLFYLTNHHKGRNDNTVTGFDMAVSNWGIAGHAVIDCTDPAAVNEKFMKPMLDTLLANIDEVDAVYVHELDEKEKALKQTISSLLGRMSGISEGVTIGDQVLVKGKECFNAMGVQLEKIVTEYSQRRREPNYILWNETQKILDGLDSDINPGAEVIQKVANSNNKTGDQMWDNLLHYVRNEITKRFVSIDDELSKENIRFKNSLVNVLYTNLKGLFGEGGNVNDDSVDMTAKLREVLEKTIAGNQQYKQIYDAIVFLDEFSFNTRATIIQAVRSQLCIINPICEEYSKPFYDFRKPQCGAEIDYFLTARLSLVEENLRHALIGIYNTPNEAFFAVAEEFYDRLTIATTSFSEETEMLTDMSDMWDQFFQEFGKKIWAEQAHDIELMNNLICKINELRPLLEKCGKQ